MIEKKEIEMKILSRIIHLSIIFVAIGWLGSITANREILMRSQSIDSARELVGWTHEINLAHQPGLYGTFAITGEYQHSFDSAAIAQAIFGSALINNTGCISTPPSFRISGSHVANRGSRELLADYFGLPTDFQSIVSFKPTISTRLIDLDLYLGLNEWYPGLWMRMHAPVVNTSWAINMCEEIINPGVLGYDAGYFSPVAVSVEDLNKNFTSFINGQVPKLSNPNGNALLFLPLIKDVISNKKFSTTKLSDIQLVVGWNPYLEDEYHLGFGLRAGVPTGTRIGFCNELFQPVIGNGHHLEMGLMITSHYTFWQDCNCDRSLGLYVDANITHLFNSVQQRTFDLLRAGPLSKYILLDQMHTPVTFALSGSPNEAATGAIAGDLTPAFSQFNSVFSPAANITNTVVKVSIPWELDATALINFTQENFGFDFGYNIWATGCEKMLICTSAQVITDQNWSLKGDSYVFGFDQVPLEPDAFTAIPLSATQSQATMYHGLNFNSTRTNAQAAVNPGIDNAQYAYGDSVNSDPTATRRLYSTNTAAQAIPANHTRTSIQPIFLTDDNLDKCGAMRRGITQKVLAHISYAVPNCSRALPYIGLGGMVEWSGKTSLIDTSTKNACQLTGTQCDDATACSSCKIGSICQWGIWLKGGVSF